MTVFTHLLYNIPFWGSHIGYWEDSIMVACAYDVLKHVQDLLTWCVYFGTCNVGYVHYILKGCLVQQKLNSNLVWMFQLLCWCAFCFARYNSRWRGMWPVSCPTWSCLYLLVRRLSCINGKQFLVQIFIYVSTLIDKLEILWHDWRIITGEVCILTLYTPS